MRLSNRPVLEDFGRQLERDKAALKIAEIADRSSSCSELSKRISNGLVVVVGEEARQPLHSSIASPAKTER